MGDGPRCAECGGSVDGTLPWAICPRCLLRTGMSEGGDLPPVKLRCPFCAHPVEIDRTTMARDVACPACRGHFSLIDDGEQPERSLGRFDLVKIVGAGSFGTVWKAWDRQLSRTVALKLPHRRPSGILEAEDFLREARAAAQLKHPGIVSVYEAGDEEGQIYIVSDYVEGLKLDHWVNVNPLTSHDVAELCAKIADALDYAHEAGIVHRDLKPSNILVNDRGEPHILDFGLAKREAGEINMTFEGRVLGTPAYMSPEQARGESHQADRRSDVYSLGVILFELLTGEKPFRGNPQTLLYQVMHEDPPLLRKLQNRVPRDLETVCLKCLEKEPRKRYGSAREVAEELQRFLRGEPVLAHPVTKLQRAGRWCMRNPLTTALVAALAAAILLMSVAGPIVAMHESEARQRAEEEKRQTLFIYAQGAKYLRRSISSLRDRVEQTPTGSPQRRELAELCNDLSWLLCNDVSWTLSTSIEVHAYRTRDAVDLAQTAVYFFPDEAKYTRTLGLALCRGRDYKRALEVLQGSVAAARRGENPAATYLCMAMVCARMNKQEEARRWYDQAASAANEPGEGKAEYETLKDEAAAVIGLSVPGRTPAR